MKYTKNIIAYLTIVISFAALIYIVILKGQHIRPLLNDNIANTQLSINNAFQDFIAQIVQHIQSPFALLLLQIIAILVTCRIVGWIFRLLKQPTVIGEILAGIILGPSVLGSVAPAVALMLFPTESLHNIDILSHFGLILFMFTIGMELDLNEVRKNWHASLLISHTATIVPFFFGVLTAYFVYDQYAYPNTPFMAFALFVGIAMSITAFPVLARIIQEKKYTRTHLGTLALASAANGDIAAWCILAAVMALSTAGNMVSALFNIGFAVAYVAVVYFIVRPLLQMIGNLYHNKEVVSKPLVMIMFLLLLASAYLTELLGLHALFGAFMIGIAMPENLRFRKIMTEKVEDVSLALFLPLFFASTGLRTEIGLLNSLDMWILCATFIAVAVAGKFGGTVVAAKLANENWKNSLLLGGLMNTRGLMELIVLTIGYEMNILPPTIFVMLVLMTLVTTFMTTPLLSLIGFAFRAKEKISLLRSEQLKPNTFKVLLSFGRAGNGQILLDVAHQMFSKGNGRLELTALHLTVGSDVNPLQTDQFEKVSFAPIKYEAKKLNMPIQTRYGVSSNAGQTIIQNANDDHFDFLLVGAGIATSNLSNDVQANSIHRSFLKVFKRIAPPALIYSPASLIQDKTRIFIAQSHCPVGVFVNRGFVTASHVLIVIHSAQDVVLLAYATTLLRATQGTVSLLNRSTFVTEGNETINQSINQFVHDTKDTIVLPEKDLMNETFAGHDFMLVSYNTWNILTTEAHEALKDMPSTLIINDPPNGE